MIPPITLFGLVVGVLAGLATFAIAGRRRRAAGAAAGVLAAAAIALVVSQLSHLPGPPPAVAQPSEPDPRAREAEVEAEATADAPAIRHLFAHDPELHEQVRHDLAGVLELHGSDDPLLRGEIAAVFAGLDARLMQGAAGAQDASVLAYLARDLALDAALQRDQVQLCADHELGRGLDPAVLAPGERTLFDAMQTSVVDAYLQAGQTPAAVPKRAEVEALLRSAMAAPVPLSAAETAAFGHLAEQPAAFVCALRLKVFGNVARLPPAQAALLMRYFMHGA